MTECSSTNLSIRLVRFSVHVRSVQALCTLIAASRGSSLRIDTVRLLRDVRGHGLCREAPSEGQERSICTSMVSLAVPSSASSTVDVPVLPEGDADSVLLTYAQGWVMGVATWFR